MTRATRGRLIAAGVWIVACAALAAVHVEFTFGVISVGVGLLGLGTFLAALGMLVGIVVMIWRRTKRALAFSAAAFACFVSAFILGHEINSRLAKQTEATGDRIVAALECYHRDKGRYPATLADLTPAYLAETPMTCLGISRRPFHYGAGDGASFGLSFDKPLGYIAMYSPNDGGWIVRD